MNMAKSIFQNLIGSAPLRLNKRSASTSNCYLNLLIENRDKEHFRYAQMFVFAERIHHIKVGKNSKETKLNQLFSNRWTLYFKQNSLSSPRSMVMLLDFEKIFPFFFPQAYEGTSRGENEKRFRNTLHQVSGTRIHYCLNLRPINRYKWHIFYKSYK